MSFLLVAFVGLVGGVLVERVTSSGHPETLDAPAASQPGTQRRRRDRRRTATRVFTGIAVLVVLALVGVLVWATVIFNRIEKVPVADALSSGTGTNWLLVGADNSLSGGPGREGTPVEGSTQALGQLLFREYLLPFEIMAVLLLVALVGVVLLSKKDLK